MISSSERSGIPVRPANPLIGKGCRVESYPGGALLSVDTTDFEEFCDFAVGWNLDHQPLGREKPHIEMSGVTAPSFQHAMVKQSAGYSSQGTNPKGTVSIAVPLDERRLMTHCGRAVAAGQMVITHSGDQFELINMRGAHHFITSFSHSRLEQYAADFLNEPHLQRRLINRFQFQHLAHWQQYVKACSTILSDVRNQPALLNDARCTALLEDRLLETLLVQGYVDPKHPTDRSRYQVARRAYRCLLEVIDEVPSIRNLCAITGASYATLERGYREIYGMAPQVHIKALRLSRARKELRKPGTNTTVTDVAVRWGFFELGRFAVQYRQRFGEMPSDTLRKARGDSGSMSFQ